jgi:hypothetical protein
MPTLLPSTPPLKPEYAALRDGTSVVIRAVSAADRPRIAALFARMTADELDFLLGNGADHVVVAVVTGAGAGEVVRGIGRYVVVADQPDIAEVAFELADADAGIATLLFARLARIARERGVRELRAEVDNPAMLGVLEPRGLAIHERCSCGSYSVEMPTARPAPVPRHAGY